MGSLGINAVTGFAFNPDTLELYATGEFYGEGHKLFVVDPEAPGATHPRRFR